MPNRRLKNGQIVTVPPGLSRGGEQDWVLNNVEGVTFQDVGIEPQQPEPGGRFNRFSQGIDRFLAERGVTFGRTPDMSIPPAPSIQTTLGRAALPVGAGLAVSAIPGLNAGIPAIIAQGGVAAGIESTREGSTGRSTATAGGLGALGQGAGELLGRAGSGILNNVRGRVTRTPVTLPPGSRDTLLTDIAKAARGGGGLNSAIRTNQRAINFATARALGFTDDVARGVRDLDEPFLLAARSNVDDAYLVARPFDDVSIDGARQALADIPDAASPRVNDLRNALADFGDTIPPERWQAIQRSAREAAKDLRGNQNWGQWATRIDDAVDALDDAAVLAGGDRAGLGRANQQYKLLATLEEINAVVEEGVLPAGELVRKLGRENFKGFGRRSIAEGSERMIPEIQDLVRVSKQVAQFNRQTAGNSATAGRLGQFGPPASAVKGLINRDLSPGQALSLGTLGVAPRLGGLAATGTPGAGARLGALGQAAAARDSE